jgi:hypothetical protein
MTQTGSDGTMSKKVPTVVNEQSDSDKVQISNSKLLNTKIFDSNLPDQKGGIWAG